MRMTLSQANVQVRNEFPPNIENLKKHFPCDEDTIYTYAPYVYTPNGNKLSRSLLVHEAVHVKQQGADPEAWWSRYISEPAFRYSQELQAHQAEYRQYCRTNKDREDRNEYLLSIAQRLSGSLYGNVVTLRDAAKAIRKGEFR